MKTKPRERPSFLATPKGIMLNPGWFTIGFISCTNYQDNYDRNREYAKRFESIQEITPQLKLHLRSGRVTFMESLEFHTTKTVYRNKETDAVYQSWSEVPFNLENEVPLSLKNEKVDLPESEWRVNIKTRFPDDVRTNLYGPLEILV
jgi:hypothetical protein